MAVNSGRSCWDSWNSCRPRLHFDSRLSLLSCRCRVTSFLRCQISLVVISVTCVYFWLIRSFTVPAYTWSISVRGPLQFILLLFSKWFFTKNVLDLCDGFAAFLIRMVLDPYLLFPVMTLFNFKTEKSWGLVLMLLAVSKMAAAMVGYLQSLQVRYLFPSLLA